MHARLCMLLLVLVCLYIRGLQHVCTPPFAYGAWSCIARTSFTVWLLLPLIAVDADKRACGGA